MQWVSLRLHGSLSMLERSRPQWIQRALEGLRPQRISVSRLRRLFEEVRRDKHVKGLFLEIEDLHGGFATREALRRELMALRDAGKRVVVYLPEGGDQATLMLASAADTIWLAPPAVVTWLGPAASRTYIKPLLDRIGVEIDVLAQGAYKTAAEPLSRDTMSEREREQLSAIVATLTDRLTGDLSTRPKLDRTSVEALFAKGMFNAEQAVELGLADAALYEDEVYSKLGFDKRHRPLRASRYLASRGKPLFLPLRPPSRVAVLRLEGAIGAGSTGRGIEQRPTTAVLRSLAENPHVAGVILYIDSPGGSAIASDLLHREIERLATRKPVVAWLGNVAASGGYYLAVAASKIIAESTTITGSIGVISIRPVLSKLFAELGIKREVVKQTDHADIHDFSRPLTAAERASLEAESEHFYLRFLEVVATGRAQPVDAIRALAGGRVWSGRDAKEHGLVDELGGYVEARAALDQLLEARGLHAEREAIIVAPSKRRDVTPPAPLMTALDALGVRVPEVSLVRDLLALSSTRQRALYYYALDVPAEA